MDRLDYYIEKQYGNDPKWFKEEVLQGSHAKRINDVINNRDYLAGRHKVLLRQDSQYKGKILVVRKTILNYCKTVLKFHNTFLLGKPVQLSCDDENTVKTLTDVYRLGQYDTVDYQILDRVNKFGDAYEAVYVDNGTIKSKVLDNACSYPVYDDKSNYIAFIEHWTDAYTAVTFWVTILPMWNIGIMKVEKNAWYLLIHLLVCLFITIISMMRTITVVSRCLVIWYRLWTN